MFPRQSSRTAALVTLLVALVLTGCSTLSLGTRLSEERAQSYADEAVVMARAGDIQGALEFVEDRFGRKLSPEVGFLRAYTLGWLYEQRATREASREDLLEAEAHYRAALELQPNHPDASVNLAMLLHRRALPQAGTPGFETDLVEAIEVLDAASDDLGDDEVVNRDRRYARLVAIGDLYLELASANPRLDRDRLDQALDAYGQAHALQPDDDLAPLQTVAAYGLWARRGASSTSPHEWAIRLEAASLEFDQPGSLAAARAGYELLMEHAVAEPLADEELAVRSLEAWLRLEARAGTFSIGGLATLPAAELWPEQSAPLVLELETLGAAPESADSLEHWTASPRRRQILAAVLQSLGAQAAIEGEYARAAEFYLVALRVGPELEAYLLPAADASLEEGDDPVPALEHERLIGLDVALDFLLLAQGHADEADPDGVRFDAVLGDELFARENLEAIAALDLAGLQRLHTVLGMVFADRNAWGVDQPWIDPWRTAPSHLREAVEVALLNPAVENGEHERPLPHLAALLGDGLRPVERAPHEAVRAYLDAALGFHDLGDEELARQAFDDARQLSALLVLAQGGDLILVEDALGIRQGGFFPRRWLPRGWFVAGTASQFIASNEASDLEEDLLGMGQVADVSLDTEAFGGKLIIGYQFDAPFAVEFGYTNMGELESDISASAPISPTLPKDISEAHPFLGDGFTLAMRANVWGGGPVTLTARAGAWAWDADKSLTVNTPGGPEISEIDERGFDLFFGVGAVFGEWRGFSALVEYDRYFLDGDGVDSFSIGLLYGFGK